MVPLRHRGLHLDSAQRVDSVDIYPCPRHQQPELPAVVGGGQLHVQLLPDVVVLAVGGPRAEQVVLRVAQAGSSYIELDIS